jgi:hypothetical protein
MNNRTPKNLSEALELLNWTTPRSPATLAAMGRPIPGQRHARLPSPVPDRRDDHPARMQRLLRGATTMTTTFHITRVRDGFTISDGHGVALVDATYDTEAGAADMAIRFAQDEGVLPYAIYYDSGSRLV